MPEVQLQIAIRRATPADAVTIAAILLGAFQEYRPQYTAAAYNATTIPAEVILGRMAEGPVWVAINQQLVCGTIGAVARGETLYLRSMAVLPQVRGGGIGLRLLQEVEHYARQAGFRSLSLLTTPFLTEAIHLYQNAGFKPTEDGPKDFYGTPVINMTKPL